MLLTSIKLDLSPLQAIMRNCWSTVGLSLWNVGMLGWRREDREELWCLWTPCRLLVGIQPPYPKADMETALSLDAQTLLLTHVEGLVRASHHQKEKGIGPANTGKGGSQQIGFPVTVKSLEKKGGRKMIVLGARETWEVTTYYYLCGLGYPPENQHPHPSASSSENGNHYIIINL